MLDAVRQGVIDLRAQGWGDGAILAHIANQPTSAEYAELQLAVAGNVGTARARAMTQLIKSVIKENSQTNVDTDLTEGAPTRRIRHRQPREIQK